MAVICEDAAMIIRDRHLDIADFTALTGWAVEEQGLCRETVCVPATDLVSTTRSTGRIDALDAAQRLGMPVEHDAEHGVWALGPATVTGRALSGARAEFPSDLVDRNGERFDFESLRGRRIVMVAWASW